MDKCWRFVKVVVLPRITPVILQASFFIVARQVKWCLTQCFGAKESVSLVQIAVALVYHFEMQD